MAAFEQLRLAVVLMFLALASSASASIQFFKNCTVPQYKGGGAPYPPGSKGEGLWWFDRHLYPPEDSKCGGCVSMSSYPGFNDAARSIYLFPSYNATVWQDNNCQGIALTITRPRLHSLCGKAFKCLLNSISSFRICEV